MHGIGLRLSSKNANGGGDEITEGQCKKAAVLADKQRKVWQWLILDASPILLMTYPYNLWGSFMELGFRHIFRITRWNWEIVQCRCCIEGMWLLYHANWSIVTIMIVTADHRYCWCCIATILSWRASPMFARWCEGLYQSKSLDTNHGNHLHLDFSSSIDMSCISTDIRLRRTDISVIATLEQMEVVRAPNYPFNHSWQRSVCEFHHSCD